MPSLVQQPAVLEHPRRILDRDLPPALALDPQPRPPAKELAHVIDEHPGLWICELDRLDRLVGLLEKIDTSGLTAKEIKDKIIGDVERFSEGAPQHDDMTVVVIKVL